MSNSKSELRSAPAMVNGKRNLSITSDSDGQNIIRGYAVVWDSESVDLGGFTEVIKRGAFKKTLKENPNVAALLEHKSELLLGRAPNTLRLWEDNVGLAFELILPNTSVANDLVESMRRGDISGCSFRMNSPTVKWNKNRTFREVIEVGLMAEITITAFPAYEATVATLKTDSLPTSKPETLDQTTWALVEKVKTIKAEIEADNLKRKAEAQKAYQKIKQMRAEIAEDDRKAARQRSTSKHSTSRVAALAMDQMNQIINPPSPAEIQRKNAETVGEMTWNLYHSKQHRKRK